MVVGQAPVTLKDDGVGSGGVDVKTSRPPARLLGRKANMLPEQYISMDLGKNDLRITGFATPLPCFKLV